MTGAGGKYFTIAQPIAKEDFLSLYQEVSLLAKLVFAPFGVSSETLSLLGRESFLLVYGSVYQQLEDVLSKCLFKFHGLEDDRVVASMHKFVGQTQDEQIMSEIKPVRETLLRLASPAQVVEFSFSRETDLDALLSAQNATSLQEALSRAIARLRAIAREATQGNKKNDANNDEDGKSDDNNDDSKAAKFDAERASNVDERVQQFFGITIARRVASPILELFSLTTKDAPQLAEALSALLHVLRVRVPVRRAIDSLSREKHESNHVDGENDVDNTGEGEEEISLSFEQYVALFEQLHAQRDALQSGEHESESNWFLHPVVAFVLQLSQRVKGLSENESVGEEEKERMEKSLSFTLRALSALSQCAKEDENDRDGEHAVSQLSEELLGLLQEDEDDVVVPVFLHVQLLLARAKAYLSVGDAGAAFLDVQRALTLDLLSAAAYTVRSELLLSGFPILSYVSDSEAQTMRESARQTLCALLTESSAAEGEAEKIAVTLTAVSDEEVVLHQAAEDALLAFLLGGSSDIALAAAAEEAARETCRTYARRAFAAQQERERLRERLALIADSTEQETTPQKEVAERAFVCEHWPRPWLLSAYLSGYELLSSSLSLHGAPCEHCVCEEDVSTSESTGAESSESVDCDIDEGVYADTQRERQRGRERAPPAHLLSPAAEVDESTNGSEGVSERETETKTETMYELRKRDVDAYALLCELVHELERAIAPSGAARTDKETETNTEKDTETENNSDTHTDSESVECSAATISHWESFADCETALCGARLVDFGVADLEMCDAQENNNSMCESENVCASEIIVGEREPSVSDGVVCDDNVDGCVSVSPSTHFARCLSLCLAQSDLTGVRFTRQGRVDSILFPFSPYEYKEVKAAPPTHSHSHSHRESTEEEDFARRFAAQFGFSEREGEKDEEEVCEEESVWEDCEDCEEESAWESCVSDEEGVKEIEKDKDELDRERHNLEETATAETATESVSVDVSEGEKDTVSERNPETVVEETIANESVLEPVPESVPESKTEDVSVSDTERDAANEEGSEKLPVVVCAEDELDCEHHELAHAEELTETKKKTETQKKEEVSPKLRARLLSLCASLAYLAGDAEGAVQCFEASLSLDNTLIDSKIKLAALLVDMDETDKAKTLFDEVLTVAPTHPVALLHCAELHIHRNAFDEAVRTLRKARHALSSYSSSLSQWCGSSAEDLPSDCHPYWATLLAERETEEERERLRNGRATVSLSQPLWQRDCARKRDESKAHLQSNVSALLGVSLFRENPQRPELALSLLEDALLQFPDNAVLLLCSGEVHSQCGDMVKSIKLFKRVSESEREKLTAAASATKEEGEKERESIPGAGHPLSWLNAARTYQQLGQLSAAHRHLQVALSLDPSLSMTRVDQAQLLRQQNDLEGAVKAIDAARERARQTSEIRDVLTARYVVLLQQSLKEKGLYDAEISV